MLRCYRAFHFIIKVPVHVFKDIAHRDGIRTTQIAHCFNNWLIKYIIYYCKTEYAWTHSTCTPGFALVQTIITCTRIKIPTHDSSRVVWVLYTDVLPLGFTSCWSCETILAVMGFCYWFLTLQSCFFFDFCFFFCCILNLLLNCML